MSTSFLLSFLMLHVLFSGASNAQTITCKVKTVNSGDTLTISDKTGKTYKARLYGIDAPENKQKFGEQAHRMLFVMVRDKDIDVSVAGLDSRGLPYVHVYVNGASVNGAMVKSGYAWVLPEGCKDKPCETWRSFQVFASTNKKGFWQTPNAESPWAWRKRKSKSEATANGWSDDDGNFTYTRSYARKVDTRKKTNKRRST